MKHFLNSNVFILLLLISCNSFSNKQKKTAIATIAYDYSGCFASGKSKIIIYKADTFIIAELENEEKLKVKAKLDSTQLDTLYKFISDLKGLNNGGFCTTVSHYQVNYGGETINRTDNSCHWNGFENLKGCLFRNRYFP